MGTKLIVIDKYDKKFIDVLYSFIPKTESQTASAIKCGIVPSRISSIKLYKVRPTLEEVNKIMETFNGNWTKLRESAKSHVLFRYWNVLYPNNAPIEEIYVVIQKIVEGRNIKNMEIANMIGVTQGYISRIFCGKLNLSYEKFTHICNVLDLEENETMYRLLEIRSSSKVDLAEFTRIIKSKRNELGYSCEYMAEKTDMKPERYQAYENGECIMSVVKLARISGLLGLDFDYLYDLAAKARIIRVYEVCDATKSEIERYSIPNQKKAESILPVLLEIALINKIRAYEDGQYNYKEIEGHTFVTLLILIMSNTRTYEKNKVDIMYYLNNIEREGNLCDKLIRNGLENLGTSELLTAYKNDSGLTFDDISQITNFSKGYLSIIFKRKSIPMYIGTDICQLVGMPGSIIIERAIQDYKTQKKITGIERPIKNIARIEEIKELLRVRDNWLLWDVEISTEVICNVIEVITESSSAFKRYEKIKKLNDLPNQLFLKVNKK